MKRKVKRAEKIKTKEMPFWIKVLAVLDYIGAVCFILFGITLLILAPVIGKTGIDKIQNEYISGADYQQLLQNNPDLAKSTLELTMAVLKGLTYIGIVLIILGVIYFFIGRGLWKGKNWARIVESVFSVLGLILSLSSLFSGNFFSIFSILINGLIAWYLLFNKNVLIAFGVK